MLKWSLKIHFCSKDAAFIFHMRNLTNRKNERAITGVIKDKRSTYNDSPKLQGYTRANLFIKSKIARKVNTNTIIEIALYLMSDPISNFLWNEKKDSSRKNRIVDCSMLKTKCQ